MRTEDLWHDVSTALRAYLMRRLPRREDVDDVLQDIFLRIHAGLPNLDDASRVYAWIHRITRHAVADYYRTRPVPHSEIDEEAEASGLESDFQDGAQGAADGGVDGDVQDFAACVRPMVDRLAPKYREALILADLEGVTQKEVAARLGLSLSGAKSRVQRARAQLREMLLECCHVQIDRYGHVLDYHRRSSGCPVCAPDAKG